MFRDNNVTGTEYTLGVPSGEYRIWVKAISAYDNSSGLWSRPVEFSVVEFDDTSQPEESPVDVVLTGKSDFVLTWMVDRVTETGHDEKAKQDAVAETAQMMARASVSRDVIGIASNGHAVGIASSASEVLDQSYELLNNLMTPLGQTSPITSVLDFTRAEEHKHD